jgi:hypothetical protein
MTSQELRETGDQPPAGFAPLVEAMWWEAHGNWERAHLVAQDIATPDGAWVHAYLHRVEGDNGNAGYWYRQASQPVCRTSLQEEWHSIVTALLR